MIIYYLNKRFNNNCICGKCNPHHHKRQVYQLIRFHILGNLVFQLRQIATVLLQNCSCPNPFFLFGLKSASPEKSLHQLSNFATTTSTTTRQAARQSFNTQASNCFTRSRTKRAHLDDAK